MVTQQFQTAQFLPAAVREPLGDELTCYARFVVYQEWPELEAGTERDVNVWEVAMFRTLKEAKPKTPVEQSAYDKWLDETTDRGQPVRTGSTVPLG